jgi:hypothetical protein
MGRSGDAFWSGGKDRSTGRADFDDLADESDDVERNPRENVEKNHLLHLHLAECEVGFQDATLGPRSTARTIGRMHCAPPRFPPVSLADVRVPTFRLTKPTTGLPRPPAPGATRQARS